MNKFLTSFADVLPVMQEKLESGGEVTFIVSGVSMQPMIINRRDSVTIKKATYPLKKYDIPFYRRDDGQFVLHRIVKVQKNGNYTCRGDNQTFNEYDVRDDQVIGVVTAFERNGKRVMVEKSFKYKLYCRSRMVVWRFRMLAYYLKRIKKSVFKA